MHSVSDDAACQIGSDLLLNSKSRVLEVRRGSTLIFHVAKADDPKR
jgi:hypothetical protein